MGVQIFCLISCAPPIKLGQLTYPIKRDNPDVNIKIWPFFFFFCFFSLVAAFGFFFFPFLYVVDISSVHLHPHFAPVTDTSSLHLHLQVFICFYWFLERKSSGFFCYQTFWGFDVRVKCGEKQSDLSTVIMVFDFCSIMKHVKRKTILDDVKVVVRK